MLLGVLAEFVQSLMVLAKTRHSLELITADEEVNLTQVVLKN